MARGLTDIAIQNLKAGDTRREVPDPACAGLYVIVQPSGRKSFAVRYRFAGLPRKLTLQSGVSLAAARKLTADAMHEVAQGRDPSEAKKVTSAKARAAETNTVRALCETYLSREAGKLRTGRERRRALERLVYPEIGHIPLADLKRSHIVKMLDGIEDRNGTKMADLTLAYVRKVFNWHAGRVDDFNSPIVRGMSRYDAKANQGTRVLSDDELRKLWAATEPNATAPQPFHALVRFLLLTAARRDEARELTWPEINGSDWLLPAARNKVRVDLTRPLSKAAQDVLRGLPEIEGGSFVFTNDGHHPLSLTAPFARLAATIGVADWRLHDLRRTARTLLSRAGVISDVAEMCLGHVLPGAVRQIYDRHRYEAEKAQAYEALAVQIERVVNPQADALKVVRLR
jgi:integrase